MVGPNEAKVVNETFRAMKRRGAAELVSIEDKEKVFSELRTKVSHLDWSTFLDALRILENVRTHAYKLGDQVHDGVLTKRSGFEHLRAAFPEVGRDVLDHAFAQGLYESSK